MVVMVRPGVLRGRIQPGVVGGGAGLGRVVAPRHGGAVAAHVVRALAGVAGGTGAGALEPVTRGGRRLPGKGLVATVWARSILKYRQVKDIYLYICLQVLQYM